MIYSSFSKIFSGFQFLTPYTTKENFQEVLSILNRLFPSPSLSFLNTFFPLLFRAKWKRSLNNRGKKQASRIMTKAISFPSLVSCALQKKRDFQKQRFTHTHTLMNERLDHIFYLHNVFFCYRFAWRWRKFYASLIWSWEDWWVLVLGLFCYHKPDICVLVCIVKCQTFSDPLWEIYMKTFLGFFWKFRNETFFKSLSCLPAIIENARCRQLINLTIFLCSIKISLHIINYNVSKCDLSSTKKKEKTSRRPKIIFYHRNRWRRKKNRLKIDVEIESF